MFLSLDFLIVLILGGFFLIGLIRGFIRQLGSIVVFFIAMWLASTFQDVGASYIKPFLKDWKLIADSIAKSISFFLIFFVGSFVLNIAVRVIDGIFNKIASLAFVKTTNRIGGAVIGFFEGLLLVSVILYTLSFFVPIVPSLNKWMKESKLTPLVGKVSFIVKPLLPDMTDIGKQLNQVQPLLNQIDTIQKTGTLPDGSKVDQKALLDTLHKAGVK